MIDYDDDGRFYQIGLVCARTADTGTLFTACVHQLDRRKLYWNLQCTPNVQVQMHHNERYIFQDVQGSIDAKRPCPPSKRGGTAVSTEAPATPAGPTQTTVDAEADQQKATTPATTARASSAGPKLPPAPPAAAASPCMVKTDLREFIAAQRSAVSAALALNPAQSPTAERKPYKWPTKTLGSQVGGSLTKLTGQDSDASGGRHRACGSSYRIGKKT